MDTAVPEPDGAVPLAKVIGKNARRLRRDDAGLTLEKVGVAARMCGLSWSESRVADFEAGKVAPNLGTLIAFCLALANAGCDKATLPELLHSPGLPIQINDSLELSDEQVINLVTGRPARTPKPPLGQKRKKVPRSDPGLEALKSAIAELSPPPDKRAILRALIIASGATEERTFKALGISRMELADLSARLWNRTFSEERDRRAGAGANAQKRGQVSRQMREELRATIEAGIYGDDQ
jgi:hypothetical protein